MTTIRQVTKHGRIKFELDFGRMGPHKRVRRYFDTKAQANTRRAEIEDERRALGDAWADLESRRKWVILECLREMHDQDVSIADVWKFYQEHHAKLDTKTLASAVDEYLEVKAEAGRRPKYLENATLSLRRFLQGRENHSVGKIGPNDVRSFIHGTGGADWSKQTFKKRLNTFFAWAVRQGYANENPVEKLESIQVSMPEPEILSVEQCRRLVIAARQIDPDYLAYLGLALFLGIRPDECRRLPWSAIDLEGMRVTISADVAKTRDRRIVEINEPAFRILSKVKRKPNFTTNWKKRAPAVRKLAGIKNWPNDVLRHTAATHFYNAYGVNKATEQLGHSADIMLRHYRKLVTKEQTEEWLGNK